MNVSRRSPTGLTLSRHKSGELRRASRLLADRSRLLEKLILAPDKAALSIAPFLPHQHPTTLNRCIDVKACKDIAFVQR